MGLSNTAWLCLRTLVRTLSDVVAVQFALRGLGVEGYGVYSSVTGVAAALLFLDGTLNVTGRRFLAARMVAGKESFLVAFRTLFLMALVISALVVVCGETFAAAFVRTRLAFPPGTEGAAMPVFHLSVGIMVLRLLLTPMSAALMAAERMRALAGLSLVEAAVSLSAAAIVCLRGFSSPVDYAALTLVGAAIVLFAYGACCGRKTGLPRSSGELDIGYLREQGGFFAWMSSAAVANMLKYHGVCSLLGVYAGTSLSATWSMSMKAGFGLYAVAGCVQTAFFPRSVKLWESGDRRGFASVASVTFWLALSATALCASPFLFAPDISLRLCFGGDLPPQATAFMRCVALHFVIDAMKCPVHSAVLSTGKVSLYQSVDSLIMVSGFVLAWISLAVGFPAWTSVASVTATNALSFAFRFAYMSKATGISAREFLTAVFRRDSGASVVV